VKNVLTFVYHEGRGDLLAMTTTTQSNDTDQKHGNKHRDKNNRRDRRTSGQQPVLRRSAADLVATPPRGYTCSVHELEPDNKSRKRTRLLILESEYGWKFVPFMTVRVEKTAQTAGADISVLDDFDIIPSNIIESGIEVNLLSDDVLLNLAALAAEYRERQKTIVPAHKRPVVHRPFERKLAGINIEEEDEMAKKNAAASATKPHTQSKPVEPRKPTRNESSWWFAAAC
jgi:hypothetical protein